LKYFPATMFRQCILGPPNFFDILTLFLFTFKADCKNGWTSYRINLINIFSNFFWILLLRIEGSKWFQHRIRLKCWYLVLKFATESIVTKIRKYILQIQFTPSYNSNFLKYVFENLLQNWMNLMLSKY
jgi:hypothetical protein